MMVVSHVGGSLNGQNPVRTFEVSIDNNSSALEAYTDAQIERVKSNVF